MIKRSAVRAQAIKLEHAGAAVATRALPAALAAILLGAFMVIGVGFAHSNVVHNAAHDGRHALNFPCH